MLFVTGWYLPVAEEIVGIATLLYVRQYAGEEGLLLTLMAVLILGDSAQPFFLVFKELRALFLSGIGLLVIYDLLVGRMHFNKELLYLLPMAIIACLALFRSPMLEAALPRTIAYFLLPFVLFHYGEKVMSLRFYRMLIYGAHFIIWLGIVLYIIDPSFASFGSGFQHFRMNGVFGNPNSLAIFSFFCYILTLYGLKQKLLPFYWGRFHLFLLFMAVVLTGSRAALGGVLLFTLLYYLFSYWQTFSVVQKYVYLPLATLGAGTAAYIIIIQSDYLSRRLRLFSLSNFGDRWRIWEPAMEKFMEAPWIGKGLFSEAFIFGNTASTSSSGSSENGFLSLLLSFGILGTLAFFFFLYRQWQNFQDKTIQWPFALAVIFISCFYSWIIAPLNGFLILFYCSILVLKNIAWNRTYNNNN